MELNPTEIELIFKKGQVRGMNELLNMETPGRIDTSETFEDILLDLIKIKGTI